MSAVNTSIAAVSMLSAQIMLEATPVLVLLDTKEMEYYAVSASVCIQNHVRKFILHKYVFAFEFLSLFQTAMMVISNLSMEQLLQKEG